MIKRVLLGTDPCLSICAVAVGRRQLPLLADLLRVRARGHRAARRAEGQLDDGDPPGAVSPVWTRRGRSRPGAVSLALLVPGRPGAGRAPHVHRSTEIAVGIERPMGTDFQRTVLWVFFGMSLFLLWDRWLVHTGKPSMFGTTPTPPPAAAPADAAKAGGAARRAGRAGAPPPAATALPTAAAPGAVPAQGPSAAAAARAAPVVIQTDVLKVAIDPEGAVVSRAELLKEKVAPDWTASGLLGLVTGKKHDADRNTVLLEVSPNRVYVTQSGVVGGQLPEPPHALHGRRRAARTGSGPGHAAGDLRVGERRRAGHQDLHVPPRPPRHRGDARGGQHRRRAGDAVGVPADRARRQQAGGRVVAVLHVHRARSSTRTRRSSRRSSSRPSRRTSPSCRRRPTTAGSA